MAQTPVATLDDYSQLIQGDDFDNFKAFSHFLAKGHLTPSGDFSNDNFEQTFTYIFTNIVPQWQPFNDGNWRVIEEALRKYANDEGRTLYIITGAGEYQGWSFLCFWNIV